MKYVILVPDGMAGLPIEELDGRTCMEAAVKKNMDSIAKQGMVGTVRNVPKGMIPASDVANLSILGYDPKKYYCGRGPLEAANMDIDLAENHVAFRFNMITTSGKKIADYSAGHISSEESRALVSLLNKKLGNERLVFYPGCSYRNILVIKCKDRNEAMRLSGITCHPPHDIMDKEMDNFLPDDKELVNLMMSSKSIFAECDINKVRIDLGQNPADMIWLWGQGLKPEMPKFKEAFGISGAIISAVDLIKGMGKILGMEVIEVQGATGYYDTNYEGKAEAAINALKSKDLVFVHVEAPDEAGHNGDVREKINAIENFDSKIVAKIMKYLNDGKDYRILVLPDHPTPVKLRTHTANPVPFVMAGSGIKSDEVAVFSEHTAQFGDNFIESGHDLMKMFLLNK